MRRLQFIFLALLIGDVSAGGLNHYRRNGQQPRRMQKHSSVVNALNRNKHKLMREMANKTWDSALYDESKSVVEDESVLARLLMTRATIAEDEATSSQLLVDGQVIAGDKKAALPEEYFILPIPLRPPWTRSMSKATLLELEEQAFVSWRRRLAHIEDAYDALLTPYEKSPFFWRQLWRVVERGDVVVQVVDSRDPLLYRSDPLEDLVSNSRDLGEEFDSTDAFQHTEVNVGDTPTSGAGKVNVILLNKADLVPQHAREAWAQYFEAQDCHFFFFSAVQESNSTQAADNTTQPDSDHSASLEEPPSSGDDISHSQVNEEGSARVLSADELLQELGDLGRARRARMGGGDGTGGSGTRRVVLSFVGFPNVGKSSVLNTLTARFDGVKRVAQAASPGKTKHLQTLLVGEDICLCDCPGLVFPSVMSSRSEMVCAGMLNIHSVREILPPIQLICDRVRMTVLEELYGISVQGKRTVLRPQQDPLGTMRAARLQRLGGTGVSDAAVAVVQRYEAADLLLAYCRKRSMFQQQSGNADFNRAGRVILSDYVGGKIPHWAEPPP